MLLRMTQESDLDSLIRRRIKGLRVARGWTLDALAARCFLISGTASLRLGERTIVVPTGHAAEFSTMVPHLITAHDGPVEILVLLDHEGERAHEHGLDNLAPSAAAAPEL